MPPSIVDRPSARRPSASCRGPTRFSTISPTASMSPVVSVMITRATMHIAMMALTSNVGNPKWNGVLMPNQGCSAAPLKSVRPNGMAIRVPRISPSRIDRRWNAGGANRSMARMINSVSRAKPG